MIPTQSPPEQIVPPVPHPLNPTTASPAPASCAQPAAFDATSSTPSHDIDLWTRAYEIFQNREPELMKDYKKHLAFLQNDTVASEDSLTPRSVKYIVKQLLEDREKKQWRVPLLGKDIKVREQAERFAKFLLWSAPIVENALSAQPYAALAWSGVSLLLPLLTSGTAQNEAMLKGFNSITDVQVYWEICEKTYLKSSHQQVYEDLIEPLAKLYSHVIEYQARVICYLSRAQLSRAWQNVVGWNDWAGKASEVNTLTERCSSYIPHLQEEEIRERWNRQLQEIQESRAILKEIHRILEEGGIHNRKNYEDQRERDLLQDLASDYEGYKNFNPQKVVGTCEWFFNDDRFRKWRESNTSGLLWVSAGPGCGKSVLSRALIDERRLSTNITTSTVCYFFFKDGDERRMHSTNALCAILHQLFTQDPSGNLIEKALPSHKDYGKALAQNFSKLWELLVKCVKSSETGEVVCILDAIDECDRKSREILINTLRNFCSRPQRQSDLSSNLKFLITSRPYDDLESYFGEFLTTNYLRFDGDDKSADIGREINLVIDERVNKIAGHFTAADRHKISERLKSMENRTYLWLYLIFDTINVKPSQYGKRSSIERLLSAIPSQVSEAYEKILSRSQDEEQTEILLRIILAAAQPMTLHEANFALTCALQDERFTSHAALESELWPRDNFGSIVKNLCGLFISVYDSKLSFIHQTAREFLIHPKRHGTWQGRLHMSKSHSTISRSCLHYLLLPDIDILGKDSLEKYKQYSFLPYAAAHWPLHYLSQEPNVANQSRKDARTLCNVSGHQASIWAPKYLERRNWELKGWTDLALASYLGLQVVVKDIFLEKKIDSNMQVGYYGTALWAASREGHKEVVKMLLDQSPNIDLGDREKTIGAETALQAASARGNKDVVQMLLDQGADINLEGEIFGTPLQNASRGGYIEVVQILLDWGADINLEDRVDTALRAASEGGHKETVKKLLDQGADVNLEGSVFGTALQAASARGYKEVVQILLDRGADINLEGRSGTALQAASEEGHREVVQILLDKGANINLKGRSGTALQAASAKGYEKVVQILLDRGADVNLGGGFCGTALRAASEGGHKEVVQMLLDEGAIIYPGS